MDPQHQQWRPRPPIPGTLCPICSFSHFPFCPPHPNFNQNPIFPNCSGHPFQRPGFDSYMGTQSPFVGNPNGFENPRPWQRIPNFDVDRYGKFPYRNGLTPPPQGPPPYEYGGNAYVSEGDRNFKRQRVDGLGLKTEFNPNNASFSSDNERRLKLIHDHGGAGSVSDCNTIPNGETNKYADQSKDSRPVNESQHSHVNVPYYDHTNQLPQPYGMQRHAVRQPLGQQHMPGVAPHGTPITNENGGYFSPPASGRFVSENAGHMRASRSFSGQPSLPTTSPPPLPMDPPSKSPPSLFPVSYGSSPMMSSAYPPYPESHSPAQPYFHSKPFSHASTGYIMEQSHAAHQISSKQYIGEGYPFPRKQSYLDKPKVIDATHLFKQPHRVTRPDHFVIILRGLPGSGKSYLAKMLRDLEVEIGGNAPRIHSMDDYFMTEVEKVEESDVSKSSSSARGKKRVVKKVMEYCYEPEMEEAYRSSMLKAFKKTLEEGVFTFIIVDDRNLRVADFAQFWAIAKSSGYEVYILEAPYKDPVGCGARNVHGFTQDDIQKMAGQWEEAPTLYLQLDTKSLFHGDGLKESDIQEVDMDTEDAYNDGSPGLEERKPEKIIAPPAEDDAHIGSSHGGKSLDAEEDHPTAEVKELGRSKWSEILYDDDSEKAEGVKGKFNTLSGLINAYRKEAKSVCWSDQVGYTGFSIAAAKKANVVSLVIGPGSGYNLKSNPLPEEENSTTHGRLSSGESKKQKAFQEQLRAERDSFKAVFDRRRQRIGGLGLGEE
ncbi:uncharacterized protein LOC126599773 [Malus sylvestris]|uniref:uncharacterized protein LOC126599773 n=1 Tax=Malus sylvestris TaxID=3752 RepID=UPI0021AC8926|nr:uncharacterized protein LOC126599773 [Malus sylvestris]